MIATMADSAITTIMDAVMTTIGTNANRGIRHIIAGFLFFALPTAQTKICAVTLLRARRIRSQ
jgi:hypothetical protein